MYIYTVSFLVSFPLCGARSAGAFLRMSRRGNARLTAERENALKAPGYFGLRLA